MIDFEVRRNDEDGWYYLIPHTKIAKRICAIRAKRKETLALKTKEQAEKAVNWHMEHVYG